MDQCQAKKRERERGIQALSSFKPLLSLVGVQFGKKKLLFFGTWEILWKEELPPPMHISFFLVDLTLICCRRVVVQVVEEVGLKPSPPTNLEFNSTYDQMVGLWKPHDRLFFDGVLVMGPATW